MAPRAACAIAALAIGIAFAAEAAATDRPAAAAPVPEHTAQEIEHAQNTSLGVTIGGFILGGVGGLLTLGLAGTPWVWAGAFASSALFAVGPSIGHYMLGHPLRATLTMLGRLALGTVGTALFSIGFIKGMFGSGTDGGALMGGGAACWVVSLALSTTDLVTFGAYSRPERSKKDAAAVVAPTAWIGPDAAGLAAIGAF
jgi:hypothetical protein